MYEEVIVRPHKRLKDWDFCGRLKSSVVQDGRSISLVFKPSRGNKLVTSLEETLVKFLDENGFILVDSTEFFQRKRRAFSVKK